MTDTSRKKLFSSFLFGQPQHAHSFWIGMTRNMSYAAYQWSASNQSVESLFYANGEPTLDRKAGENAKITLEW